MEEKKRVKARNLDKNACILWLTGILIVLGVMKYYQELTPFALNLPYITAIKQNVSIGDRDIINLDYTEIDRQAATIKYQGTCDSLLLGTPRN